MHTVPVYNQTGSKVGDVTLEDTLFNVKVKPLVVQQAIRTIQANRRQPIAHTKDRSDVRGGGKKPWRQKGTGRARHGSSRSPLWIGGGVTFGPTKERNFSLKMNRKAKRAALFMGLTDKAQDKKIVVLDTLSLPSIKTKMLADMLKKLPVKKTVLLILPSVDQAVIKSARNIPSLTTIQASSLNIEAILKHEYMLLPQASLDTLKKTFLK
ncbi:MAG: 50S ribosomal protein L4 [Patescibacteria group bacterium]